jgi:hypothetical protein
MEGKNRKTHKLVNKKRSENNLAMWRRFLTAKNFFRRPTVADLMIKR